MSRSLLLLHKIRSFGLLLRRELRFAMARAHRVFVSFVVAFLARGQDVEPYHVIDCCRRKERTESRRQGETSARRCRQGARPGAYE